MLSMGGALGVEGAHTADGTNLLRTARFSTAQKAQAPRGFMINATLLQARNLVKRSVPDGGQCFLRRTILNCVGAHVRLCGNGQIRAFEAEASIPLSYCI